ncbi:DNA primase [Sphingomonas sp. 3-13AW]|uniref:DNA primase n=1 Tax=Sphingomonas sp. 3-13AW TaxID=3050450 RepID=UPI003BB6665A
MGGHQVPGLGSGDSFDEEGYDESQRAEILEVTSDGPTDGTLLTDIEPDLGDDDDDDEDDLLMEDDELGSEDDDDDAEVDPEDQEEDELQEDFDEDDLPEDDDLDDPDRAALEP